MTLRRPRGNPRFPGEWHSFFAFNHSEPCQKKPRCSGYGDRDEGYGDCSECGGSGTKRWFERWWTGYLCANLYDALCCHRAFVEGHSAGLTDAND